MMFVYLMMADTKAKFRRMLFVCILCSLVWREARTQSFANEFCRTYPRSVNVESQADVTIGAVLPIHNPGEGVFGCGRPTTEGIQVFEAMRWAVSVLNYNSGLISDPLGSGSSLIPGVKIGLKVYDSCGHEASAIQHLTSMFPVLRSGPVTCSPDISNSSLTIGVVDMTQATSNPDVSEAMKDYFIPSVSLSMATVVSAERLARVLSEVTSALKWSNIVLIHVEEEYSIHVTKILTQTAGSSKICIANVHTIPLSEHQGNRKDLRHLRKVLQTATAKLPDNTGVLIINQGGESSKHILQVMAEMPETVSRLQWLFSWIPSPSAMVGLGGLLARSRIFSLAPYPARVSQLETHWSELSHVATLKNPGDQWFLEYAMAQMGCRIPGFVDSAYGTLPICDELNLTEMPLDVLLRTSRSVPALTAVFTLATAFQRAWEVKCTGSAGICPQLRSMSRKEFVGQFLEPIEFLANRDEDDVTTRRSPRDTSEETIEGSKLALTKYSFDPQHGVNFTQVLVCDNKGPQILDDTFTPVPSSCPATGCRTCFRPRQSRLEEPLDAMDSIDDVVSINNNTEDIIIPFLLPLHQSGNTPFECSSAINPEAIQDLEAALWTVDKINSDSSFLSGLKLGIGVVDTCASPLLTTQKLTTYIMSSGFSIHNGMIFVSSTSPEETIAARSVLKSLNISVVSTTDITSYLTSASGLGLENYLFQVASPGELKVQTALEVLNYIGWRFVSAVYETDEGSRKTYKEFSKAAKSQGVCVGLNLEIRPDSSDSEVDKILQNLASSKKQGSRIVLLWTRKDTSRRLIRAFGKFLEAGVFNPGDLILIFLGDLGEQPYFTEGLEKEALGSVVIKPERGDVPEFVAHFQQLLPENNQRNPWFGSLWQQEETRSRMMSFSTCPGGQCIPEEERILNYTPRVSTVNTIQAVVSIAAGMARLRNEVCQGEDGLCHTLLQQPLPQLVSQYMVFTASPRQDHLGHLFKFNYKGYGDTPIEVYNFRKGNGKNFTHHKVGTYDGRLTMLANMVTYTSTGEVPMDSIPSECVADCLRCRSSSAGHVVIPSRDNLYIAATVGLHEPDNNPLTCGKLQPTRGFQNFEALLWTLDNINSNPKLLPGIELGLVAFDTCNSREKASMDVSNFLTGAFTEGELPDPENVVGFVADEAGHVIRPAADLTMPLKMVTIATAALTTDFGDSKKYPYLLKMSLPNEYITTCLLSLLRYFHWNYISVVYSEALGDYGMSAEAYREFQLKSEEHGMKMALVEKVQPDDVDLTSTMDIIVHRLKIKQSTGARAVLLFLPPKMIEHLLAAVKRLQHTGRTQPGDFVWISYDSLESFQMYPEQSLGAIAVRPSAGRIPNFKDYFTNLNIRNNSRNPWLREYWEQVFNCRGSSCYSGLHNSLQQVGFIQDRTVPKTVNSVLAIVQGLDFLLKSMCPEQSGYGPCHAFKDRVAVRERLFEFVQKVRFTGADGRPVKFVDKNTAAGTIDVYNFRDIRDELHAFVPIGQYDVASGLSINTTRARGYDGQGREVEMFEVSSSCNSSSNCGPSDVMATSTPVMKIPTNQEFVIGMFLPVHQPGDNMFTCSDIIDEESFQNLLGLNYALGLINRNETILPEIQLGALVFDHCGRRQRAEEQIFSFIASDGILPFGDVGVKPRAVVAALTFDPEIADDLSPLFDSMIVPQIASPGTLLTPTANIQRRSGRSVEIHVPEPRITVIADLLQRMNWRYVNIIHGGVDAGSAKLWSFLDAAKKQKICIAETIIIELRTTVPEIADSLLEKFPSSESRVVVLLMDDAFLIRNILEAAKTISLIEKFVWIGMEKNKDGKVIAQVLRDSDVDVFMIRTETYDVPGFKDYYSALTLGKHEPIPDAWFEEFWQRHFRCHLPSSTVVQMKYPDACTGTENLSSVPAQQDRFVYHTVETVTTIAFTLHDYLRRYCIHGDAAMNLDDCGHDAREILTREMRKAMKVDSANCEDEEDCGPIKISVGFQIFQMRRSEGHHIYQQVGLWKNDELSLLMDDVRFTTGAKPESQCRIQCGRCQDQFNLDPEEQIAQKSLYANFRSLWGVIGLALSLLGVLLVVICAAYFLISFQVTVGTTVLGYMILFGLLLLYAINFAFILSPTEGTCGVRRFGLGLSYAIIFSGMLVKVMNIWRMMGYHGNRLLNDSYHLTSPAALLVIAVGLVIIQVILSSAWLILVPPKIGLLEGEWRCHPATTFEDNLVISLVYVMLMLAITILFAILTWRSTDNNRESRWIFTCCVLVTLVWVCWTVVSTQVRHRYRDLTIVLANLVCATVVMLCMYLRKVYLYNKLTKDQEFKNKQLQPTLVVPNMYGPASNMNPVPFKHCGPQTSLNGRLYGSDRSVPSRMALIACSSDDATSEGSSSAQVQAADLYPLDMYDGGSQFQPASLQLGGSSLVLDEAFSR